MIAKKPETQRHMWTWRPALFLKYQDFYFYGNNQIRNFNLAFYRSPLNEQFVLVSIGEVSSHIETRPSTLKTWRPTPLVNHLAVFPSVTPDFGISGQVWNLQVWPLTISTILTFDGVGKANFCALLQTYHIMNLEEVPALSNFISLPGNSNAWSSLRTTEQFWTLLTQCNFRSK